jgi:hypothetical protein
MTEEMVFVTVNCFIRGGTFGSYAPSLIQRTDEIAQPSGVAPEAG